MKALVIAIRRGVAVRIVVPARSNHRLADIVAAPYLRDLAALGAEVRRYLPGMLHAKALLVDDDLVAVGSANFDVRSLFLNYEAAFLFYGSHEVKTLSVWFERTCADTDASLPPAGRIRRPFEAVARLLAPLV